MRIDIPNVWCYLRATMSVMPRIMTSFMAFGRLQIQTKISCVRDIGCSEDIQENIKTTASDEHTVPYSLLYVQSWKCFHHTILENKTDTDLASKLEVYCRHCFNMAQTANTFYYNRTMQSSKFILALLFLLRNITYYIPSWMLYHPKFGKFGWTNYSWSTKQEPYFLNIKSYGSQLHNYELPVFLYKYIIRFKSMRIFSKDKRNISLQIVLANLYHPTGLLHIFIHWLTRIIWDLCPPCYLSGRIEQLCGPHDALDHEG